MAIFTVGFLAAVAVQRRPHDYKHLKLAEAVAACGVRVIADEAVREHKREVIAALRPGALKFTAPLLLCAGRFLSLLTCFWVLEYRPTKAGYYSWLGVMLCAFVYSMASIFLLHEPVTIPTLASGVIGILGLLLATGLELLIDHPVMAAMSHWERAPWQTWFGIPPHIQRLAELVNIPDARLKVEYLEHDPFLVVERGWGLFRKSSYIAAWNTGNIYLDQFANYA
jgi:hypothetical protein